MIARLGILVAALAALAVLAASCGDDDDSSASEGGVPEVTTSALTKAQFIKEANAACRAERKDILERISAYLEERKGDDRPEEELYAQMFEDLLVPTVEAEMEKVAAVGAPEGDEKKLEAIFARQAEALDEVRAMERVKGVEEFEDHFVEADKLIRAYGFEDCTNSADPNEFG